VSGEEHSRKKGNAKAASKPASGSSPSKTGRGNRTVSCNEEGQRMATQSANEVAWWAKTRNLMLLSLAIWAVFSFIIHMFVTSLNSVTILGFPLGFYMAAQGSLIIFVAQLFWFAGAQDKIDREHGVAED
jgi:putative solute:sodium symporter small subunit